MITTAAMDHLRVLVLFEPGVEAFAERVAAGVEATGARARAGSLLTNGPEAFRHGDLVIVGAPAAVLAGRRFPAEAPVDRGQAEPPSLRTWLRDLPQAAPDRRPRGVGKPCVAAFDARVSRGRRHPSCASNVIGRALAARGFELASVPTSFLVDPVSLTPTARELARAERWGSGLATIMWAIHAGKRPSWWMTRPYDVAPAS